MSNHYGVPYFAGVVDVAGTSVVTPDGVGVFPVSINQTVPASPETSTVYNGTTALTPLFATVAASASGASTIIALVASKKIRVLALQLIASAAVNVKWQSHATPTDVTGLAYLAQNGGYVLPSCKGGANTISGTLTGGTPDHSSISILEYSGCSGIGALTQVAGTTSGGVLTCPTITLSKTGSLVLATLAAGSNTSTTPSSGATTRINNGNGIPPYVEEYAAGTQGTIITPSLTYAAASSATLMVAFELIPTIASSFRTLMGVGI